MSTVSKGFRDQAAKTLRASRKTRADSSERHVSVYVAGVYKALAHDEESLRGERQKSRKYPSNK
jgi:hypothetical protein